MSIQSPAIKMFVAFERLLDRRGKQITAMGLAAVLLYSSVAAPLAEAGFWQDRRDGRMFAGGEARKAETPPPAAQWADTLPSVQPVNRVTNVYVGARPMEDRAELKSALERLPASLKSLPAAYGDIRRVSLAKDPRAPLIVLVQDVHGLYSAQKNVAGILTSLDQPSLLVGIEGVEGGFDLKRYRDATDEDSRREAGEFLLQKSIINGPEYFGLTAEREPLLWGLEDQTLYMENVEAYRDSEDIAQNAAAVRDNLARALQDAKKVFSPGLRALDKDIQGREDGSVELTAFLKNLSVLPSVQKDLSAGRFPQVKAFLEALGMETRLDFKTVENQRRDLITLLTERLTRADLDRLVRLSLAYRAGTAGPGEYYGSLQNLLSSRSISPARYREFGDYIRYVLIAEKIDAGALTEQVEQVKDRAARSLARTSGQKTVFETAEDFRLLDKLMRHELTADEWRRYESRRASIAQLPERLGLEGGDYRAFLPVYEAFYAAASKRDRVLVDNLMKKMGAPGQSPAAVMITGGFHTPALEKELAERNMSCVTIMPKLEVTSPATAYLGVFSRHRTPLEQLLLGDKLMTNPPSVTAIRVDDSFGPLRRIFQSLWCGLLAVVALSKGNNERDVQRTVSRMIDEPVAVDVQEKGEHTRVVLRFARRAIEFLLATKSAAAQRLLKRDLSGRPPVLQATTGHCTLAVRLGVLPSRFQFSVLGPKYAGYAHLWEWAYHVPFLNLLIRPVLERMKAAGTIDVSPAKNRLAWLATLGGVGAAAALWVGVGAWAAFLVWALADAWVFSGAHVDERGNPVSRGKRLRAFVFEFMTSAVLFESALLGFTRGGTGLAILFAAVAGFALTIVHRSIDQRNAQPVTPPGISRTIHRGKTVLLIGGAGYIGSAIARDLLAKGSRVIIFDNFTQGHRYSVPQGAEVVEGDLSDANALDALLKQQAELGHPVDGVVHFAAHIEAGLSVQNPGKFFDNNVTNTQNLLDVMNANNVKQIVFSSSAGVFSGRKFVKKGDKLILTEDVFPDPQNPYGETKLAMEQTMGDYGKLGIRNVALRYFNAAAARIRNNDQHGEGHALPLSRETHALPLMANAALDPNASFSIFGDDYDTPDGTAIRDYIHIEDLSRAHLMALAWLYDGRNSETFCLGTGEGTSVQEAVDIAKEVSGRNFTVAQRPRRAGDPPVLVAGYDKAKRLLGWAPVYGIRDIVKSMWEWHSKYQPELPEDVKPERRYDEAVSVDNVRRSISGSKVLSIETKFEILFRLLVDAAHVEAVKSNKDDPLFEAARKFFSRRAEDPALAGTPYVELIEGDVPLRLRYKELLDDMYERKGPVAVKERLISLMSLYDTVSDLVKQYEAKPPAAPLPAAPAPLPRAVVLLKLYFRGLDWARLHWMAYVVHPLQFHHLPMAVGKAPGRGTIKSDHTDYSVDKKNPKAGNYTIAYALQYNMMIAASPRTDNKIIAYSRQNRQRWEFTVDELTNPDAETIARLQTTVPGWAKYLAGYFIESIKEGRYVGGMELSIEGNVPQGSGMSSSAAYGNALQQDCLELFGWQFKDEAEQVANSRKCEANEVVGSNCGDMDQKSSLKGKEGKILLIDHASGAVKEIDATRTGEYMFVNVHAGVGRELVETLYNERRAELEAFTPIMNGLMKLTGDRARTSASDFTLEELEAHGDDFLSAENKGKTAVIRFTQKREDGTTAIVEKTTTYENIYNRAHYVLLEGKHDALAFSGAMESGDMEEAGRLIDKEGAGLSMDGGFKVSGSVKVGGKMVPVLDILVRSAKENGGFARMEGGGGAGCISVMIKAKDYPAFKRAVARDYRKATGLTPRFMPALFCEGAKIAWRRPFKSVKNKNGMVERLMVNGHQVIRLSQGPNDYVDVDLLGGTPVAFRRNGVAVLSEPKDLSKDYGGAPSLYPFANRMLNGVAGYGGRVFDLSKSRLGKLTGRTGPENKNGLHGCLAKLPSRVVGAGVDGSGASVTLETVVDDSEDAGFGHSTVRRTFRLKDGQLTRDMEATNTGKEAQPLMDGWHPNVDSTPGTISDPENWTIEAPVASYYQTDRELIPLRQDPAPVEGHYDLTTPKRLNGISGEGFDTVFVLKPDVPGGKSATAILRNKKTGLVVKLHINVEENPYFVFWTGQKKDGMPMVGFEAQMYPTDALNMAAAGFGEVRMVKPGESIRSRLVLEAQTGKPAGGAVDRTEVDVIPRAEQGVLSREIGADEALHAGLNRIWENLDRIQARRLVLGRERFFFPASKMTFEQYVRMMKDSGPLSSVNRLNALAQMEAYETALRQELEALDQAQNLDEFGLHAENAALAMGLLRNSCPALAAVQRRHVEGSIGRAKRRLAGLRGSFDWKAFDAQVNLGEACADRGTQMDPRTPAQLVDARGPAAGLVDFWEQVAQQHQMLQADGKKKPTYIWTDQENAGAVISALGELNKTAHSAQIARLLEGYVEGTVIVVSVSDMREKTERIMAGNTIVVSEFLQAYNPGLKGRKPQITAADFSLLDMTGVSVWCLAILKGMPPLRMEAEEIELMGRGREALKRFA